MSETKESFSDIFMGKLKEQSFVILLMLGVIYYQHKNMEERVAFWQQQYEKKEAQINQLEKEERDALTERIKYLQDQRDIYVNEAISELKTKK
jgi:hypothetical protein